MRIPKQFGVRTTIGPREPKKKFFLVFEGEKTEYQYFEGLNANKADLDISALVEIYLLLSEFVIICFMNWKLVRTA